MKYFLKKRAFTLIELLTVIAIIGVLVALLFPAIKSALGKAEATKAQQGVSSLATAFKAYYTEYGKWPATTTDQSGIISTTNGLVALLRGEDRNGPDIPLMNNVTYNGNPRKIRFLEMKNADLYIDPANNVTNYLDPWKNQYQVVFDISYSDLTTNPFVPPPATFIHEGVLIWSKGPDGQDSSYANTGSPAGDGVGVNKDNIKSW